MIVRFVHLSAEAPADYLQLKWQSIPQTSYVDAYERALDSADTVRGSAAAVPLLGEEALPPHQQEHRKVISDMADRAIPLLDGERLVEPDAFAVFASDAIGFAQGTLVLRRTTNFSQSLCILPCTRIVDGVLYRNKSDDAAAEAVLATLKNSVLWSDVPPPASKQESAADLAAEPITMALIAQTIALGILSGIASQIGSRAISWALNSSGILDPGEHAQLTYNKLVEALAVQSREDFKRWIKADLNAFQRGVQDFNAGMRTEEKLNTLYNEIRRIVGRLEEDERAVDRVHLLAYAQCNYLAIMQEMAEWYRQSNPERMVQFYKAMAARAEKEIGIIERVRKEAFDQRMARITGLHHQSRGGAFTKVWFDDVAPRLERDWEWYEVNCVERGGPPSYICHREEPTEKGRRTLADVQGRMDRHKARIAGQLNHALRGLQETIEAWRRIAKREIPPPPPK